MAESPAESVPAEPSVVAVDDPPARDPGAVGGKAASVARLRWLGLPTPTGCCVTAGAYLRQLRVARLVEREAELRRRLPDEDARRQLEQMVSARPLHAALARELDEHVARLGQGRLAVRSSALGEDAEALSFAGQHETLLGVERHGLDRAIRVCWASLWSERAVAYRSRHSIGFDPGAMGVLIQPLLEADVSALVFTCDPVTGAPEEVLVHAAGGLAPELAGGTMTADVLAVDRASLAARVVRLADARGGSTANGAGGGRPVVTAHRAAALAELALRAERGLGRPLDLEAVWAQGRWFLLQARPITRAADGAVAGGESHAERAER